MELQFSAEHIAANPVFNSEAISPTVFRFNAENVFPKALNFQLIETGNPDIIAHEVLSFSAQNVHPNILFFDLIAVTRDKVEFDNEGETEFDNSGVTQFFN